MWGSGKAYSDAVIFQRICTFKSFAHFTVALRSRLDDRLVCTIGCVLLEYSASRCIVYKKVNLNRVGFN